MSNKKCEICNKEIAYKCAFANFKIVLNGKEHSFCCEKHADKFKKHELPNKI
jgi:YHS domain-containing protein